MKIFRAKAQRRKENKEVIMALLFIGIFIGANVGLIVASLILGAGVRDREYNEQE